MDRSYPFQQPMVAVSGQWNSSHTSTFSVFYTPLSLPEPWPNLVISFGISAGLAIWAVGSNYFSYRKTKSKKNDLDKLPGRLAISYDLVGLIYNTIRAVSTLVEAIHGNPHSTNSTYRRVASSTIFAQMMSIVPYLMSYRGIYWNAHSRIILYIDLLLVYISLCTSLSGGLRAGWNQYGTWNSTGTLCPIYVKNCQAGREVRPRFSCIDDEDGWPSQSGNHIGQSEAVIAWLGFIIGAYYVIATAASIDSRLVESLSSSHSNIDGSTACMMSFFGLFRRQNSFSLNEKKWKWNLINSAIGLALILVVVAIALPIHISGQTQLKSLYIVDRLPAEQIGNVSYSAYSTPSQWSLLADCFQVKVPTDKYGFWSIWWAEQKGNIAAKIAII